jgi:hypothetical protein
MQSHPVLDASGHVQMLGFRIQRASFATKSELDSQKRSVPDERGQILDPAQSIVHGWYPAFVLLPVHASLPYAVDSET